MSTFQNQLEKMRPTSTPTTKRPPPKTLKIRPERFADTWELRPKDTILIGLRVPSDDEEQGARNAASTIVENKSGLTEEAQNQAYNDALVAALVARAVCDPNDVLAEHPTFPLADDTIPLALSSYTLAWLFDELERLKVEQGQLFVEATDEEVKELGLFLGADEPFAGMSEKQENHVRRYLKFALELMME